MKVNKTFEIVEIKNSNSPFVRKRQNQICDLTSHKKALATLCIKYVGDKKLGSSIFINEETFYNAIENADENIKKNILKVLGKEILKTKPVKKVKSRIVDKVEDAVEDLVEDIKEYVINEKEEKLLKYDINNLSSKNMITRYWNSLTKLADNLKLDYNKIELKDFKSLRELVGKVVDL